MQQINFGTISSLLLATLLLSSCSTFNQEPQIQIVTKIEKTVVPIVSSPKPVQMNDVKIYVVTKIILKSLLKNIERKTVAMLALLLA